MTQYHFKPALLAAGLDYATDDLGITCHKAGTLIWRADWPDIDDCAYVELTARGNTIRRIDLIRRAPHLRRSISVTSDSADPPTDPDVLTFLSLASDVLARLDHQSPGRNVAFGEHGRARLAIFAVGALSIIGAIAIFGLALASGVSAQKLADGAIPMGLLLLFGVALISRYAPWRKPPRIAAATLALALGAMADPSARS